MLSSMQNKIEFILKPWVAFQAVLDLILWHDVATLGIQNSPTCPWVDSHEVHDLILQHDSALLTTQTLPRLEFSYLISPVFPI